MRDFLAATRERVIVFDGSMGATLEQYDLSLEKDYKLPGRCHEALVLNRPDVIQGVHESMIEAGAEVVETDTFQGSRIKLDEWGLGQHTLEINRRAAEIARLAVGEDRFVALARQPAVVGRREIELLEGGAHRPVEHHDALADGGQVVAHRCDASSDRPQP